MGSSNGYWKRHPRKELQQLLMEFHEAGWRVLDPPTYYKVYCPCADKHKSTLHLTPSNPKYVTNKRAWLHRQTCYKQSQGGN